MQPDGTSIRFAAGNKAHRIEKQAEAAHKQADQEWKTMLNFLRTAPTMILMKAKPPV
jgi:hypothetical protein